MIPRQMYTSHKRGCPTCAGINARSCMRCNGMTRLSEWYETETGCVPFHNLTVDEQDQVRSEYVKRTRAKRK